MGVRRWCLRRHDLAHQRRHGGGDHKAGGHDQESVRVSLGLRLLPGQRPQLFVLTAWISLVSRFVFVISIHAFAIFNANYKHVPDKLAKQMSDSTISEADFKPIADTLLGLLNSAKSFWGGVSSCQDKMLVMKMLAILHVASYIASFFSLCGLSYIALMTVFIVPRACRDHQEKIHATLHQVYSQVEKQMEGVLAAVPKASQLKGDTKKEQ